MHRNVRVANLHPDLSGAHLRAWDAIVQAMISMYVHGTAYNMNGVFRQACNRAKERRVSPAAAFTHLGLHSARTVKTSMYPSRTQSIHMMQRFDMYFRSAAHSEAVQQRTWRRTSSRRLCCNDYGGVEGPDVTRNNCRSDEGRNRTARFSSRGLSNAWRALSRCAYLSSRHSHQATLSQSKNMLEL